MNDDAALLRRYAGDRDEAAFAELVQRHLAFVYGAALRQLDGAAHRAEEVTQAVFTDLARKAAALSRRDELAGWLYTSTHFAAAKLKRTEQRRQQREQEAHTMHELLSSSPADADWERLRPVLDDAMHELDGREREVLLQRFFQGRRFAEVGERLGLSEDAARMRVERALDKLRALLAKRHITSTTAALAVALANQPAVAVPAGLAATVMGAALTGAAVGTGSAAAVATFFMNTKTTLSAVALLAIGLVVYEFYEVRSNRETVAALARERDALQGQLLGLQRRVSAAEQQNAAVQREGQAARMAKAATAVPPPSAVAPVTAANTGGGFLTFRSTSADPAEARRQIRAINGQAVDQTYAALYRQLNLTPAQREQFRELMLDCTESGEKLFRAAVAAARAQNPNFDRADQFEVFEATNAQTQLEQQAEARRVFGDGAGQAMEHYQATLPMRAIANQLASVLFNSDAPMTPAQADQLVEILANNARGPVGKIEIGALNTEAATAQAQGLLNSAQLAELQRVAVRVQEQAKADRERNTAPAATLRPAATFKPPGK